MKADILATGVGRTDAVQVTDIGVIRPLAGTWDEVIAEHKAPLRKAMVIDPAESGRVSATLALMAFEPGFDVVSVADVDAAAEWLETFVPDVLLVSAAVERTAVAQFVATVLAAPDGSACRLVSVGSVGDEEVLAGHRWHAVLTDGIGLFQWLHAIRQILRQDEQSRSQSA